MDLICGRVLFTIYGNKGQPFSTNLCTFVRTPIFSVFLLGPCPSVGSIITSKSQDNKNIGQEKKQEIRKDTAKKRDKSKVRDSSSNPPVGCKSHDEDGEGSYTSQLDEKIIGAAAGLSTLNIRRVVVENNFRSLESVDLEGLEEVKSNLIELEEVNKEGLTNLELKLTEALSSLHREFEALKAHVDGNVIAGVVVSVIVCETRIKAPKPNEFRGRKECPRR
ncbi:hypothetical protein KY290_012977 [Solanum tuberosum]|uniref:Uncharacterized protein n=1 Tax=Solanum tuberosum TaxID=4113 RepID=A0ABQ7VKD0_SOLTU|nr:hypothetical protein KY285_012741 [Solanum tuberosum]KAH0768996.1 hypothetical protein KY290_012977 [Solanum tuberosum]